MYCALLIIYIRSNVNFQMPSLTILPKWVFLSLIPVSFILFCSIFLIILAATCWFLFLFCLFTRLSFAFSHWTFVFLVHLWSSSVSNSIWLIAGTQETFIGYITKSSYFSLCLSGLSRINNFLLNEWNLWLPWYMLNITKIHFYLYNFDL